jgi:hypothetical protein
VQDTREKPPIAGVKAGAFKVGIDEGRIALDFGQPVPRSDTAVTLSNRILLDPVSVMRLISALQVCMREHDSKWGNLRRTESAAPTRSHAEPEAAGRKAAELFRVFDNLHVPYMYERSFRVSEQALAANRFLLSLGRKSVDGNFNQTVLDICGRIGMPAALREQVGANLDGVRSLHLGFEGDGRVMVKCYLEYDHSQSPPGSGDPVLLHLAFKWDAADPDNSVISRYLWYKGLPEALMLERMQRIYAASVTASLAIAREVLDAVTGRANTEDLHYLEVQEDGNERRSFDLNFYDAGLLVKDLQPQLARMREHFAIRPGQFQALYDQIKSQPAGHLAGGFHRDGWDFFNVYYGVQKRRG